MNENNEWYVDVINIRNPEVVENCQAFHSRQAFELSGNKSLRISSADS